MLELQRFEQAHHEVPRIGCVGAQHEVSRPRAVLRPEQAHRAHRFRRDEQPAESDLEAPPRRDPHGAFGFTRSPQRRHQLGRARGDRGIDQLGEVLVQRVAVLAHPLAQQLGHEAEKALLSLDQGAQVLDLIDEAPQPAAVLIAVCVAGHAPQGVEKRLAPPRGSAHAFEQRVRQHVGGQGLERHGVLRIDDHPQRGGHLADHRVVGDGAAAGHATRDARFQKAPLELAADVVFAVQHRDVAPRQTVGRAVAREVLQDPCRLGRLIREPVHLDGEGRIPQRLEALVEQPRIPLHQLPSDREDRPCRAAILIEDDRLHAVVGAKALDHFRIRPGPGEDGLLVVADGEQAAMRLGETRDDSVLHGTQVLELVHQEMVPTRRLLLGDLRVAREQLLDQHEEVVEVGLVPLAQRRDVAVEHRVHIDLEPVVLQPLCA